MVLHPVTSRRWRVEHKRSGKMVCEKQAKVVVLTPAVHVVPVQARPACVERERERERDEGGTLMLKQRMLIF